MKTLRPLPLTLLPVLFILMACSMSPGGTARLYPAAYKQAGYRQSGDSSIFEDKLVRVTVRPVSECCGSGSDLLLEDLFKDGYVLFRMDMENLSKDLPVVYNPSHTSLFAGSFDYKKPLDYAELYYAVKKKYPAEMPEDRLKALRGKFYDLNTSVAPGGKTSRMLIFYPLEPGIKRGRADLKINELYTGTDVVSITFTFSIKTERQIKNNP
ncbi:MAG: hypothetical protein HY890_08195 [Deltaproteobacteria bacterium]|nr:hypothetical protein [Deltaproteobacteria bacterium]